MSVLTIGACMIYQMHPEHIFFSCLIRLHRALWKQDFKHAGRKRAGLATVGYWYWRNYNSDVVQCPAVYELMPAAACTDALRTWFISWQQPLMHAVLSHWGQDKMATISQMIFQRTFLWMKTLEFQLQFHWKVFLKVWLTIWQHWFRWWLGAKYAKSHYLNQWYSRLLTHICVTRPQLIKRVI